MTRSAFARVLLVLGFVLLLIAQASPRSVLGEIEGAAFGELASGVGLVMTGGVLFAARTASSRRWVGYASLLLLVPGIIGGVGLGLAFFALPQPFAVIFRPCVVCAVAAVCGAFIAVGSLERRGIRLIRIAAAPRVLSARARTVRRRVAWVSLMGLGVAAWFDVPGWIWVGLAWPISWGTMVLHELARAACAWAWGYRVLHIVVGAEWPRSPALDLGGVSLVLGWMPGRGFTEFDSGATPRRLALRRVAWAGPGTGVMLIAVGCWGLVQFESGSGSLAWADLLTVSGIFSVGQLLVEQA